MITENGRRIEACIKGVGVHEDNILNCGLAHAPPWPHPRTTVASPTYHCGPAHTITDVARYCFQARVPTSFATSPSYLHTKSNCLLTSAPISRTHAKIVSTASFVAAVTNRNN